MGHKTVIWNSGRSHWEWIWEELVGGWGKGGGAGIDQWGYGHESINVDHEIDVEIRAGIHQWSGQELIKGDMELNLSERISAGIDQWGSGQ